MSNDENLGIGEELLCDFGVGFNCLEIFSVVDVNFVLGCDLYSGK